MFQINNFSSIIEVAVTLNIAFVTIEYVKSYTAVLCNRIFRFENYIRNSFQQCLDILYDRETLEHIEPKNLDGISTNIQIEATKRNDEKIRKDIDNRKEQFNEKIKNVCESKNISAISLFLSFYGLTALFLLGIENSSCGVISHSIWTFLTALTSIYCIAGLFVNSSDKWYKDFSSLRQSIVLFFLSLIISVILALIFEWGNFHWNIILFFSLFLLYSNFVSSIFKVWVKANSVKAEISESVDEIKKKCEKIKKDTDDLMSTNRVSSLIKDKNNLFNQM